MIVALLVIDFHLTGCHSLKEKRGRLRGIKDKLGKQTNVAICESDYQDSLKQSQWSFVVTSTDKVVVDQSLSAIENHIQTSVDATPTTIHREYL